MPRRLLRDGAHRRGRVAHVERRRGATTTSAVDRDLRRVAARARALAGAARPLGVVLAAGRRGANGSAPDLARFDLVGAEFPGPSEGRGYTQGRLLRERFGFARRAARPRGDPPGPGVSSRPMRLQQLRAAGERARRRAQRRCAPFRRPISPRTTSASRPARTPVGQTAERPASSGLIPQRAP